MRYGMMESSSYSCRYGDGGAHDNCHQGYIEPGEIYLQERRLSRSYTFACCWIPLGESVRREETFWDRCDTLRHGRSDVTVEVIKRTRDILLIGFVVQTKHGLYVDVLPRYFYSCSCQWHFPIGDEDGEEFFRRAIAVASRTDVEPLEEDNLIEVIEDVRTRGEGRRRRSRKK